MNVFPAMFQYTVKYIIKMNEVVRFVFLSCILFDTHGYSCFEVFLFYCSEVLYVSFVSPFVSPTVDLGETFETYLNERKTK